MYWFLIPLLLGFAFNWASVFTTAYSARWGARRGQWISAMLRDLLGIPLWVGGLVFAFRAPAPPLFAVGTVAAFVGWLLIVAGSLLIAWALVALGRRAAAPTVQDTLVQRGPYAHLRHPIYAGVLGQFAGLWLLQPTGPVVLSCLLGAGWVIVQARLEELDLLQRIPDYRDYMVRVPRFIPRLRRRSVP